MLTAESLRDEVVRLGPWHVDVEIRDGLSTAAWREAEPDAREISFIRDRRRWGLLMDALYPGGLAGRTALDCACNCGAYSFWMRELGGAGGLAFDVRERWIEQARFLQEHREAPSDGIRFEVAHLEDLPRLTDESFDVTIFKGILYHLADPMHGLRLAAERTRELLVVNTATRTDLPDGLLAAVGENADRPMLGVDGLAWLPTGPEVVAKMLAAVGFPATRCTFSAERPANRGRIELVAARDEAAFAAFDERPWPPGAPA